jgi:hypothetical protein
MSSTILCECWSSDSLIRKSLNSNDAEEGKRIVNEMSYEEVVERAAKNIGVEPSVLTGRAETVLEENKQDWLSAGRSEDDAKLMALRVAARLIRSDVERAKKSGCEIYEGMFVSVPRYKDWAEMAYNKMAGTLAGANDTMIKSLVSSGQVVVFTRDGDGWTRHYNPSLAEKQAFSEGYATSTVGDLPDSHRFAEGSTGTAFYLVWDKSSPTWPSGDSNFKYGSARPQKELSRNCTFFGRLQGSTSELSLISVRLNGPLAQTAYPTYTPGTIGLKAGKNNTAYGKPNVSVFNRNDDLATIFTGPPSELVGGFVTDKLDSLDNITAYVEANRDKDGWWDTLVAVNTEVIHIDPRDRGGFIVTCADLDLASMAPSVDVYVPAEQESLVDFGVGSTLMLIGAPWNTRDGEGRLSVTGWWCASAIQPSSDGGWDE